MKDITIGQYYPTGSLIHRLDPRVKLAGTLVFIISLFLTNSFLGYLLITMVLAGVVKLSRVPVKTLLKGLRGILFLLLISVSFNLFVTPGRPLVHFWVLQITEEGVARALFMGIRLSYLVIGTSIMTLTTTPHDLADGLEKVFSPLNRLHVPVHEIAMMMSIALRFIPILMEETDKIMKAQKSRGADFETGSLIKKVRALIPILVPLFISAIRRAVDLAMAMEARCYRGGKGRTKMKPLHYEGRDRWAYVLFALYLLGVFGFNQLLQQIPQVAFLTV